MRRAPEENRERRRLEIVRAALRILDEEGFERLSLRSVARALEMHTPGLYWYIDNKQALIDLLAKEILDEALGELAGPREGERWREWLIALAARVRAGLRAHRDGARVIAGAYLFRTHALTPALELSLEVLEEAGFARDSAMLGVSTLIRYTIGVSLDEQMSPPIPPEAYRERSTRGPLVDAERWPRVADVMERYFRRAGSLPGDVAERRFVRGVELIVAGMGTEAGVE